MKHKMSWFTCHYIDAWHDGKLLLTIPTIRLFLWITTSSIFGTEIFQIFSSFIFTLVIQCHSNFIAEQFGTTQKDELKMLWAYVIYTQAKMTFSARPKVKIVHFLSVISSWWQSRFGWQHVLIVEHIYNSRKYTSKSTLMSVSDLPRKRKFIDITKYSIAILLSKHNPHSTH